LSANTRPIERSAGLAWNEGSTLVTDPANPAIPTTLLASDLRGLGTSWGWPDGPVDGVTSRQWLAGQSVPWLSAYDVDTGPGGCGGFSWENPGDGGVQPMVLRDCVPMGVKYAVMSPEPIPVLKARTEPGVGYDAADCGAAGQWRTGCRLFFMYDVWGKKLSDSGIYAKSTSTMAVFLERATAGSPYVLARYDVQNQIRVDVDTNLVLPAWQPGERPFYEFQDVVIRVGTNLYRYPISGVARQLILSNVVSARPIKTDFSGEWLVVHHRDTAGTSCADGQCKISRVNLNGGVQQLVPGGATGKEAVFAGGVLVEQVWPTCPGGPCTIVSLVTAAATPPVPLAMGTVWPDRTQTWVPYEIGPWFLRAEGGAQIPSGL
jgi:hypothetical protein